MDLHEQNMHKLAYIMLRWPYDETYKM
jgi:hypothetical protein